MITGVAATACPPAALYYRPSLLPARAHSPCHSPSRQDASEKCGCSCLRWRLSCPKKCSRLSTRSFNSTQDFHQHPEAWPSKYVGDAEAGPGRDGARTGASEVSLSPWKHAPECYSNQDGVPLVSSRREQRRRLHLPGPWGEGMHMMPGAHEPLTERHKDATYDETSSWDGRRARL